MPRIVCVSCKKFLKPARNGVYWEEGMPVDEEKWTAYKLWASDLYECKECGIQVLAGMPSHPIAEHYEKDYETKREYYSPIFRVDDC